MRKLMYNFLKQNTPTIIAIVVCLFIFLMICQALQNLLNISSELIVFCIVILSGAVLSAIYIKINKGKGATNAINNK